MLCGSLPCRLLPWHYLVIPLALQTNENVLPKFSAQSSSCVIKQLQLHFLNLSLIVIHIPVQEDSGRRVII